MIRFNDDVACNDEAPSTEPAQEAALHRRDFQKILLASRDFLDVFHVKPAEHLAKGIFHGPADNCPTAWLSYNPVDRSVRLKIKLLDAPLFSQVQLQMLIRLQTVTTLSRFCLEDRRDGLTLEAVSICSDPDQARLVLEPMCKSLKQILQDDRIKTIVGS